MRHGDSPVYDSDLFYVRTDGSVSGSTARHGIFSSSNAPVCNRNSRNQDCLDILGIPKTSFFRCTFYFLPCIMVSYHCITSNLLLFCAEKAQKSHRDG